MSKFTDAKGREWVMDLDPAIIDDVFKELTVSIYALTDGKWEKLNELLENVPVFCNVCYIVLRDQARAASIDEREFMKGMKGDAIEAMADAFCKSIAEFCPNKKKRELIMLGLSQTKDHQEAMMPLAKQKFTRQLQKAYGELSASLESDSDV